ncbi:hypothetical protein [Phormidium sp. CCY1219]|uniref:hypothetical protein n=1 Tax=Phormidium sp. CCY1219 TaxID=2886104 RepID=UPI002D1F3D30|nr:hypothetical protein [Phormidium sp. CCY1219]MEB3829033.1 hypothetical protein [Phormidium sp. CCY1219]
MEIAKRLFAGLLMGAEGLGEDAWGEDRRHRLGDPAREGVAAGCRRGQVADGPPRGETASPCNINLPGCGAFPLAIFCSSGVQNRNRSPIKLPG